MNFRYILLALFICGISLGSTELNAQADSPSNIEDVNFYYPKNAYRPIVSNAIADYLASLKIYMDEHSSTTIVLNGYAQDGSNDEWNTRVSKYRVRALRDILVDHGISKRKIKIEYFGKTEFIAEDDSPEELAKNRRVELRFDTEI